MKQITLIRHAKVNIPNDKALYANELKYWIKQYDSAPIDKASLPNAKVEEVVAKADIFVASSLWRTEASALVLGRLPYEKNKVFNEATVPQVNIPFIKLKPKSWLVFLRILLLVGLGGKEKSLKASKAQAEKAAQRLIELSYHHDSVVLMGHGGMNWLIRKVLIKKGWTLEPHASNKNWGMTVLINEIL